MIIEVLNNDGEFVANTVKLIDEHWAKRIRDNESIIKLEERKGEKRKIGKVTKEEITKYLEEKFGFSNKKMSVNCPFHEDKNPSGLVSRWGGFKCFAGCFNGEYMNREIFYARLREEEKSSLSEDFE